MGTDYGKPSKSGKTKNWWRDAHDLQHPYRQTGSRPTSPESLSQCIPDHRGGQVANKVSGAVLHGMRFTGLATCRILRYFPHVFLHTEKDRPVRGEPLAGRQIKKKKVPVCYASFSRSVYKENEPGHTHTHGRSVYGCGSPECSQFSARLSTLPLPSSSLTTGCPRNRAVGFD